jgi:uncharacterized protein YdcH (DUF465 family)
MTKYILGILTLMLLIVAVWYQYPSWIQLIYQDGLSLNSERALFGDSFGSLNTLFSGLAFAGIITSIFLQSQELKETRAEIKGQKIEFQLQTGAINKQVFESTFFSLLDQHNKLIDKLSESNENRTDRSPTITILKKHVLCKDTLSEAKEVLEEHNYLCGHYFRVLYQLLKFVATSIPSSLIQNNFTSDSLRLGSLAPNEKMYSNIVRSFINYDLTQLLAVNCYCDDESNTYWKYKMLLDRYEFLEHMPFEVNGNESLMLSSTVHYYTTAFGKSGYLKPAV